MTVTERTLSPEQRALLLTILSDVASIRMHISGREQQSLADVVISERLDSIARKVREINGGGQA